MLKNTYIKDIEELGKYLNTIKFKFLIYVEWKDDGVFVIKSFD